MRNQLCRIYATVLFFVTTAVVLVAGVDSSFNSNNDKKEAEEKKKIAVIGGGISGTFAVKYLIDYDTYCQIDVIDVFDPSTPWDGPKEASAASKSDDDWQGSRVETLRLKDGSIIESGASIGYKDFYLVLDMIRGDPDRLQIGKPFFTGVGQTGLREGMGIYNGNQEWLLSTVNQTAFMKKVLFGWRYGYDLYRVKRICDYTLEKFANVALLLKNSTFVETFFDSPDAIWNHTGLYKYVHTSFDNLLEEMGVYSYVPFWRAFLPQQGSLRNELLTAISLVNYNQDTSEINSLVGLGNFAASAGGLFSIKGGNAQLITSAIHQATQASEQNCGGAEGGSGSNNNQVHLHAKRVTTIVGSHEGLELFDDQEELGMYDIVILAAPLQQARINFLIKSTMDPLVLQEMPLGRLIDPETHTTEEGHDLIPKGLPPSATRPYKQVVTTVIRNGTLAADLFGIPESQLPRSISFTSQGKASFHNITVITQISASAGLYKMFSNEKLTADVLNELFGPHHEVEYVKLWGGPHGGATPDYQGDGQAPGFVLWDGSAGIEGYSKSGAIYYPSAMEQSTLASMELCAVGAKAVAKLIAKRLGFVKVRSSQDDARDEL